MVIEAGSAGPDNAWLILGNLVMRYATKDASPTKTPTIAMIDSWESAMILDRERDSLPVAANNGHLID